MSWGKVIVLFLVTSFLGVSGVVGSWFFDLKASVKMDKNFAPVYNRIEGMKIKFNADGSYIIANRGGGHWGKRANSYILKSKSGKKMSAHLRKDGLLEIVQPTSRGDIRLLFSKGVLKVGFVGDYIYLDKVYKQREKIYDNGYLYYLFLDNGTFYSYASQSSSVTANEIKTKGDRLQYAFLGDKIVMRGPFKVVIKVYNKSKIVTSQNDTLYLVK